MPYLIDTNWLIDHLGNKPPARQLLSHLAEEGIATSIITYMELFQGVLENTAVETAQAELSALVSTTPNLPFTQQVAETCARVRADLKARRRRIRPRALDLQIAATAILNDLTLVTQNTVDYADIRGLRLYQPS